MTHQVSLSERAYAELKIMRRPGESFSDAVLRLIHGAPKDPLAFIRGPRLPADEAARRIADIEADRDASTEPA